jgi:methionine-rich copper-binding protein CopC
LSWPRRHWLSHCDRIDVVRNVVLLRGILVGLVLLVIGAGPASAHAALVGSDPADGSQQATAPSTATLTFNENIGNGQIAVQAPDGSTVEVTNVRTLDHTLTGTLAGADQRGTYSLSYRVVSADGHPVTGTLTYDVTTGRTVEQVDTAAKETFLHRHSSHFFWGILAAVVAIALLLAPLRRRHDSDTA